MEGAHYINEIYYNYIYIYTKYLDPRGLAPSSPPPGPSLSQEEVKIMSKTNKKKKKKIKLAAQVGAIWYSIVFVV